MTMKKKKILIADDHELFRKGLLNFLSGSRDYTVVAEAANGVEALEEVKKHGPDIALIDINMPIMDGLDLTRKIAKEFPQTKVIILSMHKTEQFAVDSLQAGASGYVIKGDDPDEVLNSLEKVAAGGRYISSSIAEDVFSKMVNIIKGAKASDPYDTLTLREKDILKLLAIGKNNKGIAKKLFISIHTVRTHRNNLMKKLDVHDISGLFKIATHKGLINDDH